MEQKSGRGNSLRRFALLAYRAVGSFNLSSRHAAQLAEMETFLKSSPLMGKDRPPPPPRLKDLVIKTVGPANGDVIEYEYEVDAAEVPCKVIIRRLKIRK